MIRSLSLFLAVGLLLSGCFETHPLRGPVVRQHGLETPHFEAQETFPGARIVTEANPSGLTGIEASRYQGAEKFRQMVRPVRAGIVVQPRGGAEVEYAVRVQARHHVEIQYPDRRHVIAQGR